MHTWHEQALHPSERTSERRLSARVAATAQPISRTLPQPGIGPADAPQAVDVALGIELQLPSVCELPLGRYHHGLVGLALAHATDLESVGLAMLLTILYRQTDSSDFRIGFSDWSVDETASQRVLQLTLSDADTFSALLSRIAQERVNAGEPEAQPAAEAPPTLRFGRARMASANAADLPAGVELNVTLVQTSDGVMWRVHGDQMRFGSERVAEICAQLAVVARQVVGDAGITLAALSLVTASARAAMPDPSREIDVPEHRPVTEAFLGWYRRAPQAVAIRHAGRTLTYSDLAHASARIARQLCAEGVEPGDTVAVTGVRSPGFVVAMLAVWRSGGVLLTLDPKLPLERRRTMMQQAGAARLVCVASSASDCQALEDLVDAVLHVDRHDGQLQGHAATGMLALPVLEPQDPAYIFFTSGSTGVPKGVKGRHAGLAHFLDWQREAFGVGPGDRASQLTALSFDVVLRDTFLALTSGATLCIPGEQDALDPGRILAWLQAEQVTTIHVVPSLARLWLNCVPRGVHLPDLRRVFFAGEPLTDVLVQRWREAFPGTFDVVNLYGPTETTLAKCYQIVPASVDAGIQAVGRALPQTQALLLNRHGGLCGLYEIGQIAIRTPFRTLGYVNNAAANRLAFVKNPWGADADDLLYLTGDSGSYLPDGRLRILGRTDNQVKIRGVRIEPGEIEACLLRHPHLREALVMACDDGRGDKMLVAYVVRRREQGNDEMHLVSDLRRYLRGLLPENMVPSAFIHMSALPLNANGKVDRKALPAPDAPRAAGCDNPDFDTPLERDVARVWAEVLNVNGVAPDQSFFDLGGHSLLAMQMANQVSRQLGASCPLSLVFEAPVLSDFCRSLERVMPASESASVITLRDAGSDTALFCVCGVHIYQALADRLEANTTVHGVFLPKEQAWYDPQQSGAEAPAAPPKLEEMAGEYVSAIREKQAEGPYLLAGLSFGGVLAFEIAQQLIAGGQQVALVAMFDSMLPVALKRDWVRWVIEHVKDLFSGGVKQKALRLLKRFARVKQIQDLGPQSATLAEADRVGALRLDFYRRLTAAYSPKPYEGLVILSRAQDKSFFASDIADPSYGWASLAKRLVVCDVPGDHISHIQDANAGTLAAELRAHLPSKH
jgi:amino acid adenylation domain-containing protein